ncbi:MAG: hypothetical protein J6M65_05630 [Eubacterium sp.]|nr:hypothetical protein [Eubacterium sp.]
MKGLNEYKIQINDVLDKAMTIKADTLDEAIDIAIDMYLKENHSIPNGNKKVEPIKKAI